MFIAMSVLIGTFCKNFMNFGGGLFRVTFENIPIILSGIIFGPIIGGIVGIATDLVSYLLSAQIYPPNLIVTFGAFLIGFLSGIMSRYIYKKKRLCSDNSVRHTFSLYRVNDSQNDRTFYVLRMAGALENTALYFDCID